MRSFGLVLVASTAGALAATMQINDLTFQDHMALTVLEGLSGMNGQKMPAVNGQQNVVDMVMSKLAAIKMDAAPTDAISGTNINLRVASLQGRSGLQLQHSSTCLFVRQAHLPCHHSGQAPRRPQQKPDPVQGYQMQYFIDKNLPNPNIAPSYGLAGVLEGIQRGTAIALGKSNDTFGNPSTSMWAAFLRKVRTGDFRNRAAHDAAWSQAFQVGLNYGVQTGDRLIGTTVGVNGHVEIPERAAVFNILVAWNILAQNEGAIGRIFSLAPVIFLPLLPYGFTADKFINWIFNVSDPKPLYCLVDAAFDDRAIAALRIEPTTFLNDINNLITIIPAFLRCYTVGANI